MTVEAGEFLGDIAAFRIERDLAEKTIIVEIEGKSGIAEPLQKILPVGRSHERRKGADPGDFADDALETGAQIGAEMLAFALLHFDELGEGAPEGGEKGLVDYGGVDACFVDAKDSGRTEKIGGSEMGVDPGIGGDASHRRDILLGEPFVEKEPIVGAFLMREEDLGREASARNRFGQQVAGLALELEEGRR